MSSNENPLREHLKNFFRGCLYFNSGRLHRRLEQLASREFSALKLAPTQGFMILALGESQGSRMTPSLLADLLQLDRSTVTRLLDGLERMGYIRRTRHGRIMGVVLTAAGRGLIPRIEEAWSNLYDRYAEIFGTDASEAFSERTNGLLESAP